MPPVNDDWADATVLSGGSGSVTFSNVGATIEAGEPTDGQGDQPNTVWFAWTAPADGPVAFWTSETPLPAWDSIIAVYTGPDLASLVFVDGDDDGDFQEGATDDYGTSKVTFDAESGETYWIQVGCWDDVSGPPERSNAKLSWGPPPPPGITSFTPTHVVVGARVDIYGHGLDAVTGASINGVAQSWEVWDSSHVDIDVAPGTTTGHIVLETPDGDLESDGLLYIGVAPDLSVAANNAPWGSPSTSLYEQGLAGDEMLLHGYDLDVVDEVTIGGVSVAFTTFTDSGYGGTGLRATVPSGARTGQVTVSNAFGSSSQDFTRLYAGPWVQPPSQWIRSAMRAERYELGWDATQTGDVIPDPPAAGFDGTVLYLPEGPGPLLSVARISSADDGLKPFTEVAGYADEWHLIAQEFVYTFDPQGRLDFYGHTLAPPVTPSTGELAPDDVYGFQIEDGPTVGGWYYGAIDDTEPLVIDIDETPTAIDDETFLEWTNQWSAGVVNSDGWGIAGVPLVPFLIRLDPLGDPIYSQRNYYGISAVPTGTDLTGEWTLQWVNDTGAAAEATSEDAWVEHGSGYDLAWYDLYDFFPAGTWDPSVVDPIEVRLLHRPTGGGAITVVTTWTTLDARRFRTDSDILHDATFEWRFVPAGDYEVVDGDVVPVHKWYTGAELDALDLMLSWSADDDYTIEGSGDVQDAGPGGEHPLGMGFDSYHYGEALTRGGPLPTPPGTPSPFVDNPGTSSDVAVQYPVEVPFSRLDDDGLLAVVFTAKRVREWDWPALPDTHLPADDDWYGAGEYWQAGRKALVSSLDGFRVAYDDPPNYLWRYRPPRYRLLYTHPATTLYVRQRQAGSPVRQRQSAMRPERQRQQRR